MLRLTLRFLLGRQKPTIYAFMSMRPSYIASRYFIFKRALINPGQRLLETGPGNSVYHAGHGESRHVTIILARCSRRVPLDSVYNSVINSKISADCLEAMPPCMVGLNAFVSHDRSNKI